MSPEAAAGSLFSLPCTCFTEIMYKFLAPVLSAQFMTAPTGRPRDILNLLPPPPLPRRDMISQRPEKIYTDRKETDKIFFSIRYHGSSSSIKCHVYHHVRGRHTPVVRNESRGPHISHYTSNKNTNKLLKPATMQSTGRIFLKLL